MYDHPICKQKAAGQIPPDTMQEALQKIYANLMALKAQEETGAISTVETSPAPPDWRKSITKNAITCLECGATFKQLSVRHLREHDLDGRSYREKYGIPRTQPLSARSVTAMRKTIAKRVRPWEKVPLYMKAHKKNGKAAPAKTRPTRRTRTSRMEG